MRGTLVVLLMLAAAGPADATHHELELASSSGAGWTSLTLTDVAPGLRVILFAQEGPPSATGLHVYDEAGGALKSVFGNQGAATVQFHVRDDRAGLEQTSGSTPAPNANQVGVAYTFQEAHERAFVVAWAAGPGVAWSVLADPAAQVHASDLLSGDQVHYNDGAGWSGTSASAGTPVGRVAGSLSSAALHVDSVFVGHLSANAVNVGLTTVSGAGQSRICPCEFFEINSATGGEEATNPVLTQGDYDISWTGASARLAGPVFAGADVRIIGLTE